MSLGSASKSMTYHEQMFSRCSEEDPSFLCLKDARWRYATALDRQAQNPNDR